MLSQPDPLLRGSSFSLSTPCRMRHWVNKPISNPYRVFPEPDNDSVLLFSTVPLYTEAELKRRQPIRYSRLQMFFSRYSLSGKKLAHGKTDVPPHRYVDLRDDRQALYPKIEILDREGHFAFHAFEHGNKLEAAGYLVFDAKTFRFSKEKTEHPLFIFLHMAQWKSVRCALLRLPNAPTTSGSRWLVRAANTLKFEFDGSRYAC